MSKVEKKLEAESDDLQERMVKREEIHAFLTVLLKDEDLRKVLVARIKEKGQGRMLLSL